MFPESTCTCGGSLSQLIVQVDNLAYMIQPRLGEILVVVLKLEYRPAKEFIHPYSGVWCEQNKGKLSFWRTQLVGRDRSGGIFLV